MIPQTLLEKLWRRHLVREAADGAGLLYVDRLLVYEVTSPQAFEGMRNAGRSVWRKESVLATCNHGVPTTSRGLEIPDPLARLQVDTLTRTCADFGINGGATLPGMMVVCGDSHTSTHGAFAALAFGVGTSDVEHVLATQCLSVNRMAPVLVQLDGLMPRGLTAKDLILAVIRRCGTAEPQAAPSNLRDLQYARCRWRVG